MPPRGKRFSQRGRGTFKVGISIDPTLTDLAARFDKCAKKFVDYKPAWKRLLPRIASEMARLASSKGTAADAPEWAPLSEAYKKRSGRKEPLVGTKMLARATSTKGKMSLTKKSLKFGVKGDHVRAVNFGKPPRRFIAATPGVERAAEQEINRHVENILREAGL